MKTKIKALVALGILYMLNVAPIYAQATGTWLTGKYQTVIKPIINAIFLIACAIALIRVVIAMMNSGERGNIGSKIGWLIGGIVLWVCFNMFLGDLGVSGVSVGN
ncbi:MAG: hypothetical protein A2275_05825 [Bacteroidetes bacterium RIFOXYA12_FULL_35_11]|nr:MAG: hypothetical protein A2X01_10990 [Bacteroidetes bacterium GWF2_35_48]OFY75000.1 MAG: hypothetical protein A2275_05825 [Bacteroidetes bacterium RIFOXYA12_FULL_35_11]OFY94590.1 MAG: hypothetical protein A2309_08715 [Bacteroidetes bacterium RIFOXYB2_FULL_35_7]HBX52805.1 hypothetical protein [Bacteroidales bacterium]